MLQRSFLTLVSCFVGVLSLQAQQSLMEDISEFRVVSPDVPSVARAGNKFDLPHGELYGSLGNGSPGVHALPATVLLPLSDFGASAGGTLFDRRNSYFVSFDRQAFDWSRLGVPANTSLLSALGRKPVDSAARSLVLSDALGRFDHRFNERDTVDLRYSRTRASSKEFAASALNAEQQMYALDNAVVLSPATVNETRGQVTAVNVQLPADALAQGIRSSFPTVRHFQVYEAADNIGHQSGNQDLRGGGSFLWDQASVAFLQGPAGNSIFRQSSRSAGFYIQDQWRIRPTLVLTAGVRYDLPFLTGVRTSGKFGPSLGFAWSPAGSPTTVLRGGYGVAYQQISLPTFLGLVDPSSDALILPRSERFRLSRESGPLSLLTPTSFLKQVYAEHLHFEFEHEFGGNARFLASYQHVRGLEVASPVSPTLTGERQDRSSNASSYDAISVAFVQQPVSWGNYKIAYAYADGSAPLLRGWDNITADKIRRASFTGTLHTPLRAGSGIWEQITHGIALTGYGDFIRENQLPGVDFVHLDARLSKEVQIGSHLRLQLFLQRSGLLQHRSQSIANLLTRLASSDEENMRTGVQVGLRIRF